MQTIWYEVYVSGVWGLVYVVCFVCCVLHHRVWCVMCVACGVICLVCGVLGSMRCSCFTSLFCLGCLNVSFLDVCLNASFPCRWQRRWCVVFWTRIVSPYMSNVLYNVNVFMRSWTPDLFVLFVLDVAGNARHAGYVPTLNTKHRAPNTEHRT